MIIDTPGYDDEGALGEKRVQKTKQILNRTDVAVLVVDAVEGRTDCDRELISLFEEKEIPYLVVYNKEDLLENVPAAELTLDFGQCLFENNGTDLDNQCQQPVDLSEATSR